MITDINSILPQVVEYFHNKKEVVVVYLFGSYADGKQHKKSDIDLAVFLRNGEKRSDDYIFDLQRIIKGVEFDIKILNESSTFFQFQVLKKGRKIYCSDEIARIRYEVKVMGEYQDFKPYLDYYNKRMYQHIKEGYLGFRYREHK